MKRIDFLPFCLFGLLLACDRQEVDTRTLPEVLDGASANSVVTPDLSKSAIESTERKAEDPLSACELPPEIGENDVFPPLVRACSECHGVNDGVATRFNFINLANRSNLLRKIKDRLELDPDDEGYMPPRQHAQQLSVCEREMVLRFAEQYIPSKAKEEEKKRIEEDEKKEEENCNLAGDIKESKIQSILSAECSSCHAAGDSRFDPAGLASNPSAREDLLDRVTRPSDHPLVMPPRGSGYELDRCEVVAIRKYVRQERQDIEDPLKCDELDIAKSKIARQTRTQLSDNFNMLFATKNYNYARFLPAESRSVHGFTNDANLLAADKRWTVRYLEALDEILPRAYDIEGSNLKRCNNTFSVCWSNVLSPAYRAIHGLGPDSGQRSAYKKLWDLAAKVSNSKRVRMIALWKRLLIDPDFVFRDLVLRNDPSGRKRRSGWQVAKLLSYMLTGRLPDDQLRAAANSGAVLDASRLRKLIEAEVGKPESMSMARVMADALLGIQDILSVERSKEKYPEFTTELRKDMLREGYVYFFRHLSSNAPIERLLNSDYSYMNASLAAFYGYTGPGGSAFERVTTPKRRGIFALGAFEALRANENAHGFVEGSPTTRGAAFLQVMGYAVPKFPDDGGVSPFDPDATGSTASMRERLAKHVADPACAGCHAYLDPVGFGLGNFNGNGQFVKHDIHGNPFDTSFELVNGRTFADYRELMEYESDRIQFYKQLTKYFLIGVLGRSLNKSETCRATKIAAGLVGGGRFDDLYFDAFMHPSVLNIEY